MTEPPPLEVTVHSPSEWLQRASWTAPRECVDWLARDVHALLEAFFDVAGACTANVKFGPVSTDQCRKFHVDYLRYRLIATYVGPGTEWVPNEHVERAVLADPPRDPELANALLVKHSASIRQATAGEVLLMKGARHEDGLGLVHRSPPIEHSRQKRVVLVVSARDR